MGVGLSSASMESAQIVHAAASVTPTKVASIAVYSPPHTLMDSLCLTLLDDAAQHTHLLAVRLQAAALVQAEQDAIEQLILYPLR